MIKVLLVISPSMIPWLFTTGRVDRWCSSNRVSRSTMELSGPTEVNARYRKSSAGQMCIRDRHRNLQLAGTDAGRKHKPAEGQGHLPDGCRVPCGMRSDTHGSGTFPLPSPGSPPVSYTHRFPSIYPQPSEIFLTRSRRRVVFPQQGGERMSTGYSSPLSLSMR